jgi:hypothetical protein
VAEPESARSGRLAGGPGTGGPGTGGAVRALRRDTESLPELVSELWALVVAYAKQETIDPLKALGRFVGYGVPAAVFTAGGFLLVSIGGLRALQTETHGHLSGNWSWAPYGIVTVFCLAVSGLAVWRIFKRPKGQP